MLDGLRTIAIVLMVMSHLTRRIYKDARIGWNDLSMLVEPLTQALFLFLVGASVVYSHRATVARDPAGIPAWRKRMLTKAGWLWLTGFVMFAVEMGWHWPHSVSNPGVLATIAIGLAVMVFLADRPRPGLAVGGLFALLFPIFAYLELTGRKVMPFNGGASPWMPNLLETCCGAWFALWLLDGPARSRRWVAAGVFAALGAMLLWHPFEDWFSKGWGRSYSRYEMVGGYDGLDQLKRFLAGTEMRTRRYSYFNPTLEAFPWLVASILGLYFVQVPAARFLDSRPMRAVLSIGRHALGCYILHLCLLAILVAIYGHKPFIPTTAWAAAVLTGLLGACYAWALGRDAWARRKRSSAPA